MELFQYLCKKCIICYPFKLRTKTHAYKKMLFKFFIKKMENINGVLNLYFFKYKFQLKYLKSRLK